MHFSIENDNSLEQLHNHQAQIDWRCYSMVGIPPSLNIYWWIKS